MQNMFTSKGELLAQLRAQRWLRAAVGIANKGPARRRCHSSAGRGPGWRPCGIGLRACAGMLADALVACVFVDVRRAASPASRPVPTVGRASPAAMAILLAEPAGSRAFD